MTLEEARRILQEKRNKGRPDAKLAQLIKQARSVLRQHGGLLNNSDKKPGRPVGVKDKVPRSAKLKVEKIIYPLVELYNSYGNTKFNKYLSQLPNQELKKISKLSLKTARELVGSKLKGRPSAEVYVKRVVAHELLKRFGSKRDQANLFPVKRHTPLRDRFRARRRGGGRLRKRLKELPKKNESRKFESS